MYTTVQTFGVKFICLFLLKMNNFIHKGRIQLIKSDSDLQKN